MSRRIQTRFHFATRRTAAPIWRNSGFPFRGTAENFPKSGKPGVPMSRRDGNRNPSTGYLGGPCRSVTETAAQVWGTSSFHVTARRKPPPGSRGARGFPFFAARRIPPNSGKLGDFHVPPRQKPWPRCGELGFPCRGNDGEPPKPAELWGFCFVARGKPPSSGNLAVSISRPDENRAPGQGNLGFHVAARP